MIPVKQLSLMLADMLKLVLNRVVCSTARNKKK